MTRRGPSRSTRAWSRRRAADDSGQILLLTLGYLLVAFALVAVARKLHIDPELALRAAAERFRARFG